MGLPLTWSISDPNQLFDALQTINMDTKGANVYRAYSQMSLYNWVQVRKPFVANVKHPGYPHLDILHDLGRKGAGKVPEKEIDKTIKAYCLEYYAGENWHDIAEWFGGPGIVIVFVAAGT